MQNNQKMSLASLNAKEIRKEIALKISELINSDLEENDKITENDINEMLEDKQMIENYQNAIAYRKMMDKQKEISDELSKKIDSKNSTKPSFNRTLLRHIKIDGSSKSNKENMQLYNDAHNEEKQQEFLYHLLNQCHNVDLTSQNTKNFADVISQVTKDPVKFHTLHTMGDLMENGIKKYDEDLYNYFMDNQSVYEGVGTRFLHMTEFAATPLYLLLPPKCMGKIPITTLSEKMFEIQEILEKKEDVIQWNEENREFNSMLDYTSKIISSYDQIGFNTKSTKIVEEAINNKIITKDNGNVKFQINDSNVNSKQFSGAIEKENNTDKLSIVSKTKEEINIGMKQTCVMKMHANYEKLKDFSANYLSTHGFFTRDSKQFKDMEKDIKDTMKDYEQFFKDVKGKNGKEKETIVKDFFENIKKKNANLEKRVRDYQEKKAQDLVKLERKNKQFNERTKKRLGITKEFDTFLKESKAQLESLEAVFNTPVMEQNKTEREQNQNKNFIDEQEIHNRIDKDLKGKTDTKKYISKNDTQKTLVNQMGQKEQENVIQ